MRTQNPRHLILTGEIYLEEAIKCEQTGDYKTAGDLYTLVMEQQKNIRKKYLSEKPDGTAEGIYDLMENRDEEERKLKNISGSIYLRAMTGRAYLPLFPSEVRVKELRKARELAETYYMESGEIEFLIAKDCISCEMENLLMEQFPER